MAEEHPRYPRNPPALPRWLIRWGFSLLYNQLAWSYDGVAWAVSLGQWQEWGRTAIPFLRGPRVLDLAHGTGNLLPALVAAGHQAVGYDLSPFMGRITRRKMARRGLSVPLARGRAQRLPFRSGTFNSVVSTFPAEFILHPLTLGEIRRVLVPDGVLVVVPVALPTDQNTLTRLIAWLFAITGQRPPRDIGPPTQLQAAGFQSETHWVSLPHSQVMVIVSRPVELPPPPIS
jgi:ubiquinone/menaquinone biosynthesis C-methylase UbiE